MIRANGQSQSSKEHRMTYGRTQGKKPDTVVCRIVQKGEHEESCFVEAKHFSITRNSNIGGYNLYKVAILCQGGINMISSSGNEFNAKTFGAHVCGMPTFFSSFLALHFLTIFFVKQRDISYYV